MRTNPITDTLTYLTGGIPDQLNLGWVRWPLLLLFYALVIASLVIAVQNWRSDPAQRTGGNVSAFIMRFMIGCMWFKESLWKLPFGTGNGLHYWTGQMTDNAAFGFYGDLIKTVVLPNFLLFDPLVYLMEVGFSVSLLLGVGVRVVPLLAVLMVLNIWIGLYRVQSEWPWSYIFLASLMASFSLYAAGRALGLDALIRRRCESRPDQTRLARFASAVT